MPHTPDFQGLKDLRDHYLSEVNKSILHRVPFETADTGIARRAEGWKSEDPITGADVGNVKSMWIMEHWAAALPGSLGAVGSAAAQRSGARFETLLVEYLNAVFDLLTAAGIRSAERFKARRGGSVASYDQYSHLNQINAMLGSNPEIEAVFGREYKVKPDVVVFRERSSPSILSGTQDDKVARYTPFFNNAREAKNARAHGGTDDEAAVLEAIVSCKFTIRSDRAQNIRTEAGSAIRMRKGKLPRIIAVTAEPMCSGGRLESIALGGGEIDCVYHTALPELADAMRAAEAEGELNRLRALIATRRIRDVSDLPFDIIL
jgi:hypothetical protein